MNKSVVIFLLLIPILAALGHDAWYYYEHQDEDPSISALGWLWKTYLPESHDSMFEMIGEEKWNQYVFPVLALPSVLAAVILDALIVLLVLIVRSLASLGSGKFTPKKQKNALGRDRGGQKKFEYKRR